MASLYYTIPKFFEERMASHDCVAACTRLDLADEYLYQLDRTKGRGRVLVFLSDAYHFGTAEYLGRPYIIRRGSFILIARPESQFDSSLTERARNDGIGIGKIGKLMGALNLDDVSKYKTPEEKEAEKRGF